MKIDLEQEETKIADFIKDVLKKTGKNKVVIGLSGGIDSATSLYLLKKSIPKENIIAIHLPYSQNDEHLKKVLEGFPEENIINMTIKPIVDICANQLGINQPSSSHDTHGTPDAHDTLRLGNIAARTRMIILYDLAKKHNALVCGTENKSEHYLGYFTRFGDEASDFEPIIHLYKTQVIELAKHLGVSKEIIEKTPTAGLWQDQTDEKEFGFTYKEADQVLYEYLEQKKTVEQILKMGFKNAEKIIQRVLKNKFKLETPYSLD